MGSSTPSSTPGQRDLGFAWALAAIVVAAAAVRIWAAQDAFWFDEVWSLLSFANVADSPAKVFTFHHDNNHHLVTLWMYFLKPQANWFVYRVPSVIAGVGTVALAGWMARRWGKFEALAATLLTASSFFLITYASEARGYALAGFFALLAWWAVDRYHARRDVGSNVTFCLAVVLGFLSHLTFLFFYAGVGLWSLVGFWNAADKRRFVIDMLRLHTVPVVFLLAFYVVDVRHMIIAGGGEPYVVTDVLAETLALVSGDAGVDAADGALALVVIAAGIAGLVGLWRDKSDLWILFGVTILVAPLVLLLVRQPEYLYPRYFYLSFVFLLLLLSYALGRLARWSWGGQLAAWTALAPLLVLANVPRTYEFLRVGRGQQMAALKYMAEHAEERYVDVQSERDFECPLELEFYSPYFADQFQVGYHRPLARSPRAPEWCIAYGKNRDYRPHPQIVDAQGRRYRYVRMFPYAGLSGYHWAIYQRDDTQAPARR